MRADRREQPGVGFADREVERAGRRGQPQRGAAAGDRRLRADPGAVATGGLHHPRWRSAWYALATVAGLTPSRWARARTAGSAAPAGRSPVRTPVSTLADISAAVVPAI
ncbi:hypothetical protein GCM10027615_34100 [Plantactinospora veratri]